MRSKKTVGSVVVLTAVAWLAGGEAGAVETSGSFYKIEIDVSGTGDERVAEIAITGKKGYHCNKLYPWKLTVKPGPGVTMSKTVYKKEDAKTFGEDRVAFAVRYRATEGAGDVQAVLKLSLCTDDRCEMKKVSLSWPAR